MPVGYGLISLPWWWQAQSGPFHHFMAHWPRGAHCPACAGNAKVTNRIKIIDAVLKRILETDDDETERRAG